MARCPSCDSENAPDQALCGKCGKPVNPEHTELQVAPAVTSDGPSQGAANSSYLMKPLLDRVPTRWRQGAKSIHQSIKETSEEKTEADEDKSVILVAISFFSLLGYLLLASLILQFGLKVFFIGYFEFFLKFFLPIGYLIGVLSLLVEFSEIAACVSVLVIAWTFWEYIGSSSPARDVTCLVGAVLLSIWITPSARRRTTELLRRDPSGQALTGRQALTVSLLFVALAWIFLSTGDLILGRTRISAENDAKTGIVSNPTLAERKVGLALSGGGYRAALFHAGVLSELRDIGIPLQVISSVSGGSIIASFYSRGGAPDDFLEAVIENRFDLERELFRLDNVVRSIGSSRVIGTTSARVLWFVGDFDRTHAQADLLDQLFLAGVTDRAGSVANRPSLMVCTTDLANGMMLGIIPEGVVQLSIRPPLERFNFANELPADNLTFSTGEFIPDAQFGLPGTERLSALVAASGAFPGALPAYPFTVGRPTDSSSARTTYLLADGGIADNTGLVLLELARRLTAAPNSVKKDGGAKEQVNPRWAVELILASDGSALAPEAVPTGTLSEFSRAMDILYSNSSGGSMLSSEQTSDKSRPKVVLISPRLIAKPADTLRVGSPYVDLPFRLERRQADAGFDPLSFTAIQLETLSFIIEHMAEAKRDLARQTLKRLMKREVITQNGWASLSRDANTDEQTLYRLVCDELNRRLGAFIGASTLRDRFDEETATSIYRLGQYLVLLDKPYIYHYLNEP
jgi:predicted acylesterase/phospholipase RssA